MDRALAEMGRKDQVREGESHVLNLDCHARHVQPRPCTTTPSVCRPAGAGAGFLSPLHKGQVETESYHVARAESRGPGTCQHWLCPGEDQSSHERVPKALRDPSTVTGDPSSTSGMVTGLNYIKHLISLAKIKVRNQQTLPKHDHGPDNQTLTSMGTMQH